MEVSKTDVDKTKPQLEEVVIDALNSLNTIIGENGSNLMVSMFVSVLNSMGKKDHLIHREIYAVAEAFNDIKPKDAIEAMLVAQLLSLHYQILKMISDSARSLTIDSQTGYVNLEIKLIRAYTAALDNYRKYSQKCGQKMIVEHVNVHSGGQAVVGQISTEKGEGGGSV